MHADAAGVVVCGSGPSLLTEESLSFLRETEQKPGWFITACKESIRFLRERNIRVDYSVSMDPGAEQVKKTHLDPHITYCIASSCNPALFDHVVNAGCKAMVFHSACGVMNEVMVYRKMFGKGDTVIGGFTAVNRAIGLMEYMGFPSPIILCGATMGWREDQDYYAPGAQGKHHNDVFMCDEGKIDGRKWFTRPDMMASAVQIARMIHTGQVKVIGESLAASLAAKPVEFLNHVARIQKADGTSHPV